MRHKSLSRGRLGFVELCSGRLGARGGFTLIELLVVMGIVASLAAILVPIVVSARRASKVATTRSLISQIEMAIDRFSEDWGYTPPDKIPAGAPTRKFTDGSKWDSFPGTSQSTEALYYCLSNPYATTKRAAYLELEAGKQALDSDSDGLPEIVDVWGRALEYRRKSYPSGAVMPGVFGTTQPDGSINPAPLDSGFDDGANPTHNPDTYDLWSYGPSGMTTTATGWVGNWR